MGFIEEERRQKEIEEVERLRNILKEVGAREKLNGVKEKVWKEGDVVELIADKQQLRGRAAELRLVANYVYLERQTSGSLLHDLLYPNNAGGVNYAMGYSDRVAVLTVGAVSVPRTKDSGGSYIYVDCRTSDLSVYRKEFNPPFFNWQRTIKLEISGEGSNVSRFIDRNLLELASKFLPSSLRRHNRPGLM